MKLHRHLAAAPQVERGGGPRAPRVLLAEDDEAMRTLLTELFEDAGYEVVPSVDGFDLLERVGDTWLGERPYDLVVSDVRMPGCTGIEALAALRQRDWLTPILLMTAFGDARTHREAERLGAAILDKPFEVDALLVRAHALVSAARDDER